MAKKQKDTLVHTAETIGAALGHVAVRLDSWKKQRASIAAEVRAIATAAQAMLAELGHAAETELKRVRRAAGARGRPLRNWRMRNAARRGKDSGAGPFGSRRHRAIMNNMKTGLVGILGVSALVLTYSQPADASALLRFNTGAASKTCDNSLAFVNAVGGNCAAVEGFTTAANSSIINFTGAVGGYNATSAGLNGTQPGTPIRASGFLTFNVTNNSGVDDLFIDFALNNFSLPLGPGLFLFAEQEAFWSVSAGDSAGFQGWGRADNSLVVPGGTATAATDACTSPRGGVPQSCAASFEVPFLRGAGNFSLTGRHVIHQAIGSDTRYSGRVEANEDPRATAVPEPTSVLLLGTGLVGVAAAIRRRRSARV